MEMKPDRESTMLDFIKSRRSTRKFQERMVPGNLIEMVVEAGRYAPSGGNNQTSHFLVIESREVLDHLANLVKQEFARMEITDGMYSSLVNSIRLSKTGKYEFHYHAPVLIAVANRKEYGNNIADCACALENMMLMANALDLGCCWINQLKWLNENETLLAYERGLGLKEDERIYGALAVGYADTKDSLPNRKPLERKGNTVTWIQGNIS